MQGIVLVQQSDSLLMRYYVTNMDKLFMLAIHY